MKTYQIHDNGGRPFIVNIDGPMVHVYKNIQDFNTGAITKSTLVMSVRADEIFIGKKSRYGTYSGLSAQKAIGNSILLRVGTKYIFIGWDIYEFKLPKNETIQEYYSNIGNSDVPYPYAIGNKYIYLMTEKVYVPKEEYNVDQHDSDVYEQYFMFPSEKTKLLNYKIIQERD